eukprot:TRINITY_DN11968_c0_g1_i2.p2 TRINITY_DN11968_c0_g1~~TRINITY_DN11968_c0_g1_i2.p2  ORF type:complete len:108 (-),score=22.32 TRINITY_DN11968_c0_g1_i2:20-343(-)
MAKAKSNILSSREASKDNITDTTIKLLEIEKEKDFLKNCNDELTDLNTALKTEVNMLQEQLKHLQLNSEKEKNELKKIHSEVMELSLIHICRCRRYAVCRSRWSPYH